MENDKKKGSEKKIKKGGAKTNRVCCIFFGEAVRSRWLALLVKVV